jgi:hypothetical protein
MILRYRCTHTPDNRSEVFTTDEYVSIAELEEAIAGWNNQAMDLFWFEYLGTGEAKPCQKSTTD